MSEQRILVRAKAKGYYDQIIQEGQVFEISNEKAFSNKWMERYDGPEQWRGNDGLMETVKVVNASSRQDAKAVEAKVEKSKEDAALNEAREQVRKEEKERAEADRKKRALAKARKEARKKNTAPSQPDTLKETQDAAPAGDDWAE